MGYFSNGTEGTDYEARYCDRCLHQDGKDGKGGCAVWLAHVLGNYDECNKEDSILHLLIPLSKDKLSNEECEMFVEKKFEDERQMHLNL
jgi:hypothetical protein